MPLKLRNHLFAVENKVAENIAKMQMTDFTGFRTNCESELDGYFIYSKLDKLYSLLKQGSWRETCPVSDELVSDEEWSTLPNRDELLEEIKFVKNYFKKYTQENKSLLVFSHNDLSLGNIIYNKKEDSIKFIDYEYGQINYQVTDFSFVMSVYVVINSFIVLGI